MKRTAILLCLLAFSACKITIAPLRMGEFGTDRSKTMNGVELSTRIVEGKNASDQRLLAPALRKQLDQKSWIEYRLWARKTLTRPYAPDLMLEVTTRGPVVSGITSARDHLGNQLAIKSKDSNTGRLTTETVQIALVPKAILKNNNQGYVVYLQGQATGMEIHTNEIDLPAYYHRGFMNRYKKY